MGDNPYSDVSLATTMGWNSCLVRTGIWKGEDVSDLEKEGILPSKVEDSFASFLSILLPP